MNEKRAVYNGYKEYYMTGLELKNFFKGCYECFGRHHSKISSLQIDFAKKYKKIKNDTLYRLFINDLFCAIFDSDSDEKIYFFGYTREKPEWAKD
ncbi:MAG: hypothetical protein AB7V16_00930 [Vulcanibacillus sp.]